jgi:pyridoxal phosphate enzyme (YggS family)
MSIAENLQRVRERIARAADSVGRHPGEITLVGVTKYVSSRETVELAAAGCTDLGESRPQELWKKSTELSALALASGESSGFPSVRWHLVGHLQRNKIARTLPLVSLIHSVDSERLLAAINETRAADVIGEPVSVLLEVNTSGELSKHGLMPDDVEPIVAIAARYPHVAVCGLMTMAALEGGATVAARNFATLRELREKLRLNAPDGIQLNELSMGMSGDFETAICEGATIIRVGSALWE